MRRAAAWWQTTTPWIALGALIIGYVVGTTGAGRSHGAVDARQADATPTRGAEQPADADVASLQTQVAELSTAAICTPAPVATATAVPSPTATATPVPPAPAGQPVPYGQDWTVTVTGLTVTKTIDLVSADGVFAIVSFTVVNETTAEANFPFFDLQLRDDAGRVYGISPTGTGAGNIAVFQRFQPGIPATTAVVFDVAADAGDQFILESVAEPTFRVQVALSRLG